MQLLNFNPNIIFFSRAWIYENKHKVAAIASAIIAIASVATFFCAFLIPSVALKITLLCTSEITGTLSFLSFFYSAIEAGWLPGPSSVAYQDYD